MAESCDVLVTGTGSFGARIVFDIAATASEPVHVIIAGRNAERLDWLVTAARARAAIYGRAATFAPHAVDLLRDDAPQQLLVDTAPKLVVQAASVQTSAVIAKSGDGWSRLVAQGGLSTTAVPQALISSRVAAAISASGKPIRLINCSYPDVVNGIIKALGHDVLCGVGNVAILSSVFAGKCCPEDPGRIKVLAHYQTITPFRRKASERAGSPPRVWQDGVEIARVFDRFSQIKLTPEPVIDVSGASGVPLMLALARDRDWAGHCPGPSGLPGGYPVRLREKELALDLPEGLSEADAIAWNAAFEQKSGLFVDAEGYAHYTGQLEEKLREHSPALAKGFWVKDLEAVYLEMVELRKCLES